MKTSEEKQKFIELRAKDYSFEKIALEIKVSKPTLIKWADEFRHEIKNLKAMIYEELSENFNLTITERIKKLGKILNGLCDELEKRDLTSLPSAKLVELILLVDNKLSKELPDTIIKTEDQIKSLKNQEILFRSFDY